MVPVTQRAAVWVWGPASICAAPLHELPLVLQAAASLRASSPCGANWLQVRSLRNPPTPLHTAAHYCESMCKTAPSQGLQLWALPPSAGVAGSQRARGQRLEPMAKPTCASGPACAPVPTS